MAGGGGTQPKYTLATTCHFDNPYRPFLEAVKTENYFELWIVPYKETISKVLPSSGGIFLSIFSYKLPRIITLRFLILWE